MASGTFFLLFARLVTKSLDVVLLIVLTRLLLPEDFGLVAIALSVVRVTEAILELPVGVALLQVPRLTRSHLDTALTLGLLRGVALAAVLFTASVPLASFYGDDRLVALTCALALAPVMRGLYSPRLYAQFKALQFGPDSVSEIVGKAAAVAAAASLAFYTQSYWAIAAGAIAAPTVQAIASYAISPFRPSLSLRHHRLFHRFLGWSMAAQTVNALNWQGDRFVLGKMVSQSDLGQFAVARDFAVTAFKVITDVVSRSAMAGLAAMKDDSAKLRRAYEMTSAALLAVGIPLCVGQALVAPELVAVLLGEKWARAVPIFQAVSFSLIFSLFANLTSSLFFAINRPDLVFSRNLYDLVFRLPATVAMILMYGLMGAVAALIAADLFLAVICLRSLKQFIGVPILRQVLIPWRSFCSAAAMAGAIQLVRWVVPHSQGAVHAMLFLLTVIPSAAAAYAATHLLLWHLCGRPEGVESHALDLARRHLRDRLPKFRAM